MRFFYFLMTLAVISGTHLHAQIIDFPDDRYEDEIDPDVEEPEGPRFLFCEEELRTELGSTVEVWDWREENYTFYRLEGQQSTLQVRPSPWFPNGNDFPVNMELLALGNQNNFDFQPSDGWEVVVKSFGTPTEPVNTPHFVLTNRKTGITRGFFYIRNNSGIYNTLLIGVGHQDSPAVTGGSGIFNYGNDGLTLPVSDFIVSTADGFTAFNSAPINTEHWALVQFPTYYDPCVCNSESQITFYADYSDDKLITLEGTGEGTSEAIYDKVDNPNSPITGIANGFNSLDKGFKFFKSASEFKEKVTPKSTDVAPKGLKFLTTSLKWIPKIGTAVILLDELIGGGKKATPTLMGYKNSFEFSADGTLETPYDPNAGLVNTPGGKHVNLNAQYNPIYDNPLGVFALMDKPILERAGWETSPVHTGFWAQGEYRYKLRAESIRYVVNAAAEYNLASGSIKAGLVFTTTAWDLDNLYVTDNETEPVGTLRRTVEFTTPMVNLECLEDYTVEFYYRYSKRDPDYGEGQRLESASIVFALVGDDTDGSLAPVTVGRYPLFLQTVGDDFEDLPDNPYNDPFANPPFAATPEEIEEQCTRPFIRPVSNFNLNRICGSRYDPTFKTKSAGGKLTSEEVGNKGIVLPDMVEQAINTNENQKVRQLSVFPNPAMDQVAVRVAGSGSVSIQLMDINGRLLLERKVDLQDGATTQQQIDVKKYTPGTYLIRVVGKDQLPKSERLVITH